jgi:hypothetical protein
VEMSHQLREVTPIPAPPILVTLLREPRQVAVFVTMRLKQKG